MPVAELVSPRFASCVLLKTCRLANPAESPFRTPTQTVLFTNTGSGARTSAEAAIREAAVCSSVVHPYVISTYYYDIKPVELEGKTSETGRQAAHGRWGRQHRQVRWIELPFASIRHSVEVAWHSALAVTLVVLQLVRAALLALLLLLLLLTAVSHACVCEGGLQIDSQACGTDWKLFLVQVGCVWVVLEAGLWQSCFNAEREMAGAYQSASCKK